MLIAPPIGCGSLSPASLIIWNAKIIIRTSKTVGSGTPALETANLNKNNDGIKEA